jgi:hypothetical protein
MLFFGSHLKKIPPEPDNARAVSSNEPTSVANIDQSPSHVDPAGSAAATPTIPVPVMVLMAAATHTLAATATAATASPTTLRECIASGGNRRDREHDCGERNREGLSGFRGHCRLLFFGS